MNENEKRNGSALGWEIGSFVLRFPNQGLFFCCLLARRDASKVNFKIIKCKFYVNKRGFFFFFLAAAG
jgi:hypothetical protein